MATIRAPGSGGQPVGKPDPLFSNRQVDQAPAPRTGPGLSASRTEPAARPGAGGSSAALARLDAGDGAHRAAPSRDNALMIGGALALVVTLGMMAGLFLLSKG